MRIYEKCRCSGLTNNRLHMMIYFCYATKPIIKKIRDIESFWNFKFVSGQLETYLNQFLDSWQLFWKYRKNIRKIRKDTEKSKISIEKSKISKSQKSCFWCFWMIWSIFDILVTQKIFSRFFFRDFFLEKYVFRMFQKYRIRRVWCSKVDISWDGVSDRHFFGCLCLGAPALQGCL